MLPKQMTEVRTSHQELEQGERLFTLKATQLIWLGLGLLEALIALRIGLKLIGANPDSLFATFIYNFSNIFLFPFEGVVNNPVIGAAVVELSSLIAMVVYALLGWAVERIIWMIFYRPRGPVVDITQTITREPIAVTRTTTSERYGE